MSEADERHRQSTVSRIESRRRDASLDAAMAHHPAGKQRVTDGSGTGNHEAIERFVQATPTERGLPPRGPHRWDPNAERLCACGKSPEAYGLPTDHNQWMNWEVWYREHIATEGPGVHIPAEHLDALTILLEYADTWVREVRDGIREGDMSDEYEAYARERNATVAGLITYIRGQQD